MRASASANSPAPNRATVFSDSKRWLVAPSQMDQARAAPRGRDGLQVRLPAIRKDLACPVLVKPADLSGPQHEDAAQYEPRDALGTGLGIDQRQRAAPGAA